MYRKKETSLKTKEIIKMANNIYNLTKMEIHYIIECELERGRELTAEEFENILLRLRKKG